MTSSWGATTYFFEWGMFFKASLSFAWKIAGQKFKPWGDLLKVVLRTYLQSSVAFHSNEDRRMHSFGLLCSRQWPWNDLSSSFPFTLKVNNWDVPFCYWKYLLPLFSRWTSLDLFFGGGGEKHWRSICIYSTTRLLNFSTCVSSNEQIIDFTLIPNNVFQLAKGAWRDMVPSAFSVIIWRKWLYVPTYENVCV